MHEPNKWMGAGAMQLGPTREEGFIVAISSMVVMRGLCEEDGAGKG